MKNIINQQVNIDINSSLNLNQNIGSTIEMKTIDKNTRLVVSENVEKVVCSNNLFIFFKLKLQDTPYNCYRSVKLKIKQANT